MFPAPVPVPRMGSKSSSGTPTALSVRGFSARRRPVRRGAMCAMVAPLMAMLLGEGFGCVEKGKETTENSWSWRILELIVVVCVYRCFLGLFWEVKLKKMPRMGH